jgi:hypothetical protein
MENKPKPRRLGNSATRRLSGSASDRLGGLISRRLGSSAAWRLGDSGHRRLGGSATRYLGDSAAWHIGNTGHRPTSYTKTRGRTPNCDLLTQRPPTTHHVVCHESQLTDDPVGRPATILISKMAEYFFSCFTCLFSAFLSLFAYFSTSISYVPNFYKLIRHLQWGIRSCLAGGKIS